MKLPLKVTHWLPDADMRNSHEGLAQQIKKKLKVDVDNLKQGEFIICVNTARNMVKMYVGGGPESEYYSLIHIRRKEGRSPFQPGALLMLPSQVLRGEKVDYTKALRAKVISDYREHHPRLAETLDAEWKTL